MTRAERFAALAVIAKVHSILACRITHCPVCKKYYEVLIAPDEEDDR
jgi:hypothetical protein